MAEGGCSDWSKYNGFRKLKGFIQGFRVANYTVKRGVKFIQEYVSPCQDEDLRQNLVLTVNGTLLYIQQFKLLGVMLLFIGYF